MIEPSRTCAGQQLGRSRQHGIALLISLVLLLIITLIGVAAARMQTLEVRMAANTHNRNIAMQAGEAALRFAEGNLQEGLYTAFTPNLSSGGGLYIFDPTVATPWYQAVTWSSLSNTVLQYSAGGPSISNDGYAAPPMFIVEQLPSVAENQDNLNMALYNTGVPPTTVYRISVRATGGDATSTVTLQSIFH